MVLLVLRLHHRVSEVVSLGVSYQAYKEYTIGLHQNAREPLTASRKIIYVILPQQYLISEKAKKGRYLANE